MDITIPDATNIEAENAEGTRCKATIQGKEWSGIHPDHRFWASVQAAIAAGEHVKQYIAPPVPDPKIAALEASDMALLKAGARSFEDLMAERIAEGKFVAQKVKDIIAERVNLRK
jgi:hypothetical protein